ncbi:hypothetical protein [Pararhodobacter aggregans]|uniref:Translation initiation factor 2 n=1 Tax=Pararhodobacter aggregans TaxID=404875 RepID=A0A2T7UWN8_9RHOB|nr:hypothetical protein [Pararhodobacter aggregans]PTX04646.1 type IV pilus biogenesis protein PilP [Pararhodobacter aggregans]PVE48986.1 hypothetical protein DDE23_00840 [Pararhodobacter aggregans]
MKPNFALKLSNDGAELLHRVPAGWAPVGSVSFDGDDIASACAGLIQQARTLEPEGIRTKLVLPESELRYATVVAPGPTDEARRYQIEAEVERLTPYGIDELAYDWSVEEDHALVVVCARETLIEAETFAEGYGFNPVSFVAHPEAGQFLGEPFFGETMVAPTLLRAGDHVQPDAEAMRIVAPRRAEPPKPAPAPKVDAPKGEAPKSETPKAAEPKAPDSKVETPKVEAAKPAAPRPAPVPDTEASAPARPLNPRVAPMTPESRAPAPVLRTPALQPIPQGFPADPGAPESTSRMGNLVRRMGNRLRREQAASAKGEAPAAPKPAPQPDPAADKTAPAVPPLRPAAAGPSPALPVTPAVPAPAATTPSVTKPSAPSEAEAKPDAEALSFASRRKAAPPVAVVPSAAPKTDATPAANPGGRIAVLPGARGEPSTGAAQRMLDRARAGAKTAFAGASAAAQNARSKASTLRRDPAAPQAPVPTPSAPTPPAPAPSMSPPPAPVTPPLDKRAARNGPGAEPLAAASRPPVNDRDKEREAEAMTIFGARGMQRAEPSLARRGLMAAGGGLLLVVAVGVWALYFSGSDDDMPLAGTGSGTVETGALPGIEAPTELATATGTAEAPAALTAPEPAATEAAAVEPEPDSAPQETASAPAPDPDQMLETLVQEALNETLPSQALPTETPTEAPAVAAETAEAPAASPEAASSGDGTQLAGTSDSPQVAPAEAAATRLSLPSGFQVPGGAEVSFAAPPPPPPFGTEFTFDSRGLVEATPEGALTPSGVTVFARRPDAVPAPRPGTIAPPPAAEAAPAETATAPAEAAPAEAPAEVAVPTPPVAAAIESAIAEAVGEAPPAEAPALADDTPRADPALAGARPLPRPERVRQIGEELEAERQATEGDQTQLVDPAEAAPSATAAAATDPAVLAGAASTTGLVDDAAATRGGDAGGGAVELAALEAPGPGGVALATLRPQRRPTDLVPPPEPTPEIDLSGATPEAVAESPMPGARPNDLAERARAILAAAAAARAAAAPAATASNNTDAEDQAGEPAQALARAEPSIPTSASVSRQATEENAIRLNRINLIGVFGTPNARRALVRLSSGRVVRVQVGDRLDGGQVAAIGDGEVRYVKNGRNEVLRIGS